MRVLIFGGRDFNKRNLAFRALDQLHEKFNFTVVIDGMARGADTLGFEWASKYGIQSERYPADWKRYNRRAGPIRNQQMINEGKPDIVVAFPGGTGTLDMKNRLIKAGIEFKTITPLGN